MGRPGRQGCSPHSWEGCERLSTAGRTVLSSGSSTAVGGAAEPSAQADVVGGFTFQHWDSQPRDNLGTI